MQSVDLSTYIVNESVPIKIMQFLRKFTGNCMSAAEMHLFCLYKLIMKFIFIVITQNIWTGKAEQIV